MITRESTLLSLHGKTGDDAGHEDRLNTSLNHVAHSLRTRTQAPTQRTVPLNLSLRAKRLRPIDGALGATRSLFVFLHLLEAHANALGERLLIQADQ